MLKESDSNRDGSVWFGNSTVSLVSVHFM
ncbi:hypothetical protein TSAR_001926 [Trichomalopsis sarcophagae]|uniref:Uncharacterized protein n=1 Tax=Trichomalopsis sarcophagae TaxID=543379 RepID=A0A232FKP6_9HYME|nr:hypothetical protein TSAR_001926 [Trichomalopsis sarcophagae]